MQKRVLGACLALLIFIADLYSKQWAVGSLAGEAPVILAPFLRLIYVENSGVAFGLFADGGAQARWILLAITVAVGSGIAVYGWRSTSPWESLACALIFGGAAGNINDRYRLGYVIDFIDAHWHSYHWPAFNVADMAITAGTLLFAAVLFLPPDKSDDKEENSL